MIIKNNEITIKICSNVLERMKQYIQKGIFSLESGGILIGKENINSNDLIIKYITVPQKKDRRGIRKFIRKDYFHVEFFKNIYEQHGKIYKYVGEWHTHNEDIPMYSLMDLNNWKKIYYEGPKNASYYHIIVGRKAFGIWKVDDGENEPVLVKTVLWEGIGE